MDSVVLVCLVKHLCNVKVDEATCIVNISFSWRDTFGDVASSSVAVSLCPCRHLVYLSSSLIIAKPIIRQQHGVKTTCMDTCMLTRTYMYDFVDPITNPTCLVHRATDGTVWRNINNHGIVSLRMCSSSGRDI